MRAVRRRLAVAYVILIAACGSRTALVGDEGEESSDDAGVTHKDGSTDSARDVEVKLDGAPDVVRNDCPDASVTFIYLISESRELYSYDVAGGIFRDIGTVNCPTSYTQAFSMAVDRQGTAYVLFWDGDNLNAQGNLFRVSTATAACKAIPEYVAGQQGFEVYGNGFATNGGGPSESLYVQGGGFGSNSGLATIDTTTFQLTFLGNNSPPIGEGELTGTGDGRLFGFFAFASDTSTFYLGELDKTNGQLLSQTQLTGVPNGTNNGGFSFAYWGGDFYFFTVPDMQNTTATRYRPSDQTYVNVATLNNATIVGAGVSTCAPQ
jgi:hypothetical protein